MHRYPSHLIEAPSCPALEGEGTISPIVLPPFAGPRHARFIDPDVPYHVISRVFQGRHLLRPTPLLNSIIVGVLGRARELYPQLLLFAIAVLSNHLHAMVQGPANQVSGFMAFVKREISRRWGNRGEVRWPGPMWASRYVATALPTAESQVNCLRYLLANGVKEGLVARPEDWPGVHCVRSLLGTGELRGKWLNGTGFCRAVDRQRRKKRPARVEPTRYLREYVVTFDPIPAWHGIPVEERRRRVRKMCDEIEEEGRRSRGGRRPLGIKGVLKIPMKRRSELPRQPWHHGNRRMICWARPQAPETRDYLMQYWAFQAAFRSASEGMRTGDSTAPFPPGGFRPPLFCAVPEPPG